MILEKEYLDGFKCNYKDGLSEQIMEISGNRINETSLVDGSFYNYSFNFFIIHENYLEIVGMGRINPKHILSSNDTIPNLVNKLKSYYLYNKRKSIIESL